MKTIILNGSPRKNMNTAQLLQSAKKGAESVGAEVEYINLFDLDYKGCRSCLACKRLDAHRCHCFWNDDLSPLLDRIFDADALILGSPIYIGHSTSQFHALLERLVFVTLSYDDYSNYFEGKVNVGVIYTMNATHEQYIQYKMGSALEGDAAMLRCLNGELRVLTSHDTLQVKDYSKYSMRAYSESHKQEVNRTQYQSDLQEAYRMGAELSNPYIEC